MLPQLLLNGFANGCLYCLVALGFAFIYNTTRIFHSAHGAVCTVCAYVCYLLFVRLELGLPVAAGGALLAAGAVGALLELLVYGPLYRRRASLTVSMLSSIGIYVVLVNLVAMIFGNEPKSLRSGVSVTYKVGSVVLTQMQAIQVLVTALVVPVVFVLLHRTRYGRMIRAARDNARLVTVLGVNLSALRILVFVAGSIVAGVSAVLVAVDVGMDPYGGMTTFLNGAIAVVVGGLGTFGGAIIGAMLLGLLQGAAAWKLSGQWTDALTLGVLILFMLFRPEGLLGRRRRVEEIPA